MRRVLLAVTLLAFATVAGAVPCGSSPGDATAVADARDAIAVACDCSTAVSHGAWVACAKAVVRGRVAANQLPRQCAGQVARCASRSTCGKPGAVACCRTTPKGTTCGIASSAARCTARGGSCSGALPSCCDACDGGGCVTTSTVTTTTLPFTYPHVPCAPGGACATGATCTPVYTASGPESLCVPDGTALCPDPVIRPGNAGLACPMTADSVAQRCAPVDVLTIGGAGLSRYQGSLCVRTDQSCNGGVFDGCGSGNPSLGLCPEGLTCYAAPLLSVPGFPQPSCGCGP